jgi:hypothetical protein
VPVGVPVCREPLAQHCFGNDILYRNRWYRRIWRELLEEVGAARVALIPFLASITYYVGACRDGCGSYDNPSSSVSNFAITHQNDIRS